MTSDKRFKPDVLDKTVIALPLFHEFEKEAKARAEDPSLPEIRHPIIIDLNLEFAGGRDEAREEVEKLIQQATGEPAEKRIDFKKKSEQYLFGEMEERFIRDLVRLDTQDVKSAIDASQRMGGRRAIYRIWPDFEFEAFITKSISTVKADAARNAFSALGADIVWAVIDSGIDGTHPHFLKHKNLQFAEGNGEKTALQHRDFTRLDGTSQTALEDRYGHGTHVAGIIGGESNVGEEIKDGNQRKRLEKISAEISYRDQDNQAVKKDVWPPIETISGMAPKCKLLSLKVLDDKGTDMPKGRSSNIIAAIDYIQELNGYGRRLLVHGVNMSVGYEFEPKWFACGQSPLCVEVDRLVRSGVVVVVAAGNTGYGTMQTIAKTVGLGVDLSINDPGNAELAITVGSTHRDMPHIYGVSYFSSKGPTGDGRLKPDLIAPGEKIISCDSGLRRTGKANEAKPEEPVPTRGTDRPPPQKEGGTQENQSANPLPSGSTGNPSEKATSVTAFYREDSGTSMAAPHVSGVIAAFLSVRREFVGQPERVKEIFVSTATDLKRARYFQGSGLVDLMRAIQSV